MSAPVVLAVFSTRTEQDVNGRILAAAEHVCISNFDVME